MKYTWDKKEIKANIKKIKRINLSSEDRRREIDFYKNLLYTIKINKHSFNPEGILLKVNDKNSEIDFNDALIYFVQGADYIPEDLYNLLTDIFTYSEDYSAFGNKYDFTKVKMSDDDLISMVLELYKNLGDKKIFNLVDEIINGNKHILNIQNDTGFTTTNTQSIGGLAMHEPLLNNNYINLFRTNTIKDVEMLAHEIFHVVFYNLIGYNELYIDNVPLLVELEGAWMSLFSAKYLESLGYKDDSIMLRLEYNNSLLVSSYYMIINHLLFSSGENGNFDLDNVNDKLKEILPIVKPIVRPDELEYYLTVNALDTSREMLAYLAGLDLIYDNDIERSLNNLFNIRVNDRNGDYLIWDQYGVTFFNDDLNNLKKEYTLVR